MIDENGAAGAIVLAVVLTNSGRRCAVQGYPGLRLRNPKGPLPTTVLHGGLAVLNRAVRRVVLASGASATVWVAYSDVPSSSQGCPGASALLVTPPGQRGTVDVVIEGAPCNHGTLRESPLLAGRLHVP